MPVLGEFTHGFAAYPLTRRIRPSQRWVCLL